MTMMRSNFTKKKEKCLEKQKKKCFLTYYLIRVIRLIAAISIEAKGFSLPVLTAQARKEGNKPRAEIN